MSNEVAAVILAAGQGTRMKSPLPKVLHEVAGAPMVVWSAKAALGAGANRVVVVVGHGRDAVREALTGAFGDRVETVVQEEQRGTGHAVQVAMDAALSDFSGRVVILYGDCPLMDPPHVDALLTAANEGSGDAALYTATIDDATGYGRILRNADGNVVGIREHKDCADDELAITEFNPGVYAFDAAFLRDALATLDSDNAAGELYLTDVIARAADRGVVASLEGDLEALSGVNDPWQLAQAARVRRMRILEALGRSGVKLMDPASTFVESDCVVDPGATLGANVHLRGKTYVAAGATIDVGCVLTDARVHRDATLLPYTVATDAEIGDAAQVGPMAHLRPGSVLGPESKVGNFSETKKTRIGRGSKVNHLSYVGDGEIGEGVNVGAGTIFCNYDGVQKHKTILEDGVFIGSDSQLIAPVTIGKGAYVASGTTVTRNVPADALAIARTKQDNNEGYAARIRRSMEAQKKKKGAG